MNCLIVDDNQMARMAMRQLVSQVDYLNLAGECTNAMEAYKAIQDKKIDLLLLDIEMPDISGVELIKNLGNKSPLIIFMTAKKEYAAEAFDLNVIDYLVKPVSASRFLQAIEKVKETRDSDREEFKIEKREFVFIRDNGVLKRINIDDIVYLEAMGDYVKVFTSLKFHVVHATLKSLEGKLSSPKFMRVHRSYIVALNKIDFIEDGVINLGHAAVPIADAYRTQLNQRLNLL
jgi:DNA-binding LytR/AlgR family response regulator